jgi:hypothetical protein
MPTKRTLLYFDGNVLQPKGDQMCSIFLMTSIIKLQWVLIWLTNITRPIPILQVQRQRLSIFLILVLTAVHNFPIIHLQQSIASCSPMVLLMLEHNLPTTKLPLCYGTSLSPVVLWVSSICFINTPDACRHLWYKPTYVSTAWKSFRNTKSQ